jgi:hypothetical protein
MEADAAGIDDRFIVALAGAETTYGTHGANSWGLNDIFNNGHQNYANVGAAVNAVINLLTTSTNPDYVDLQSAQHRAKGMPTRRISIEILIGL